MYRNEALDCRVYATAPLLMREVNFKALVRKREQKSKEPVNPVKMTDLRQGYVKVEPVDTVHVVFTRGIPWKGNHVRSTFKIPSTKSLRRMAS